MKRFALLATLLLTIPALAQQTTPPSPEDYTAALSEANAVNAQMLLRSEQMAVSIAQRDRTIVDLRKQLDAAKPKEEAPKPEAKP